MKTAIYFIVTCIISTGALMAALNMKNPFPVFFVAFGIWSLFFWRWNRRMKKQDERRSMERKFKEFMRQRRYKERF
ncbi:MAG TPA: hypothetical protein VGI43_16045 [Mucilaginibacter sp.]